MGKRRQSFHVPVNTVGANVDWLTGSFYYEKRSSFGIFLSTLHFLMLKCAAPHKMHKDCQVFYIFIFGICHLTCHLHPPAIPNTSALRYGNIYFCVLKVGMTLILWFSFLTFFLYVEVHFLPGQRQTLNSVFVLCFCQQYELNTIFSKFWYLS